ncbi:pyocin knob domain-containing protein [Mucilaginibacter sp. RS28]|uniref:Pyocin knob domain-containing protein n=1 Tax=Mucilaginibacter straminoryzae TaxID=2932774 RepID=A0A9X1X6Z4_9SPHI|nr:pyocin knob domain-containing protein [Mucilaginibacter straminoryzae]MCJ8212048.1 pyocin knob domain-containing protein [Mucilaginibacter straminoryzae]
MKNLVLVFFLILVIKSVKAQTTWGDSNSRTDYRDDAGLQGNAGAISGFYQTYNPINFPSGANSWWHLLDVRHSNPANNYAMQIAGSFFDQNLYFRKTNNNAAQAWSRVIVETPDGKVGIGTTNPGSNLTIKGISAGVSIHCVGQGYFGSLAFNRESATGSIFDPTGYAYQINNGGPDKSLHFQIYNGNGSAVTGDALTLSPSGNLGISTADTHGYRLAVNGAAIATSITVKEFNQWPDYVFKAQYNLTKLSDIKTYVDQHHHLPEIPSAQEIETNGANLGELVKLQMKKIEELTLYLIEKDKKDQKQQHEINRLKQQVTALLAGKHHIRN